jgi:ATP-binding cassette subfamily F protein uup
MVIITHDRTFLDKVATRIVELDRGRLLSYPGNYAAYQRQKEAQLAQEAVVQARADKLLAEEEVWVRKGVEARPHPQPKPDCAAGDTCDSKGPSGVKSKGG